MSWHCREAGAVGAACGPARRLHAAALTCCCAPQAMGDNRAMEYMRGQRILEINPDSPVIAQLKRTFEEAPAGSAVGQTVELLYETALLTSGFSVESPKEFAARCG